jgi:two-component system response regulator YesN
MSRNWHRTMLLSYFPIFILTLSIVIFLSFLIVNEISRSETQKANRISTAFIESSLEKAMRQVEMDVLRTMENDIIYSEFMAGRIGNTNNDAYELVKSLKALEGGSELIDSIYLYRAADQLTLSKYGIGQAAFADAACARKARISRLVGAAFL